MRYDFCKNASKLYKSFVSNYTKIMRCMLCVEQVKTFACCAVWIFQNNWYVHIFAGTEKHHNVCKVTLSLTLFSNKLNEPFFSMLFQWNKNCNCFQVYFWRNNAQIVRNFWKLHLTKTNILVPSVNSVLLNHNTVTNVDQILLLKFDIFLIGNTHRSNTPSSKSWSGW